MRKTQLPDGTYLELTGDDDAVGVDSHSGRTARWDAAESALRDSTGQIIRQVAPGRERACVAPAKPSPKHGAADAAKRFATLNTFVDQVMRHLSPVDSMVWLALFRDARHGQASASNRDLARRTGCSVRAVTNAMQALRSVHLIDGLSLSNCKGRASLYVVNGRPESCVPSLVERCNEKYSRSGAHRAPDESEQAFPTGARYAPHR
jgi:hypothetical protein